MAEVSHKPIHHNHCVTKRCQQCRSADEDENEFCRGFGRFALARTQWNVVSI